MNAIQNRILVPALRRVASFCAVLSVLILPAAPAAAIEEVCAEMQIGVNSNLKAVISIQREDGTPLGEESKSFDHDHGVCLQVPKGLKEDERFRVVYQMFPLRHKFPCGPNDPSLKSGGDKSEKYGLLARSDERKRIVFTLGKRGCVSFE